MILVLRANRDMILAGIDLNLRLIQPLFLVGKFNRVDFHFVPIPGGYVNVPVNVVEFDAARGSQRVGLMKFLCDLTAVFRSVRSQGKREQCTNRSQNYSQPGGGK